MSDFTQHLIDSDGDSSSEYWRDIKDARRAERQENREVSEAQYRDAVHAAAVSGFELHKHSDVHYSLRRMFRESSMSAGLPRWIINIYPGNRRIYRDPNTLEKAPFLKLPLTWTLIDVVRAAWCQTKDEWEDES